MSRVYSLEPRDRTGVFMGLSAVDCCLVGGGLVGAILLRLAGVPMVMAALPPAVCTAVAKVRVGGLPLREWLGLLAGWEVARWTGRRSWLATLPLLPAGDGAPPLPPVLRGVDVVEVPWGGRTLAAVRNRYHGRLTAVVAVTGPQFAGHDAAAQDALVAAWGEVLDAHAAGGAVVQVGWSEVASRASLGEDRDWAREHLAAVDGSVGDPAAYGDLVGEVAEAAIVHETVVWITVSEALAADGRGRPADRAAAHLPLALDDLLSVLAGAGLHADGPLPATGLWRLLRTRIDPGDPAVGTGLRRPSLVERMGLAVPGGGGPLALSTSWAHVRIDGSFQRVYWVESWPRRPVPADWMQGFLAAGECRAVTVLHRLLEPDRSQARVDSQLVKHAAERARKHERDRRVTEADQRSEQAVRDLEAELASGYAEALYLGLVTVAAPTLDELEASGRRLEQSARAHGMALRTLYGRQDVAWAASLPFGLAEPGLLDVVGL